MKIPRRLRNQAGSHALVDGIPFAMPISSRNSPVLMAAFAVNHARATALVPPGEIHPIRLGGKAVLVVASIDYRDTVIGKYIEYSIGIACTRGPRPVPLPLALLMRRRHGLGQYVLDLPVSTEVSVKGGKGIWGMPKHQANLDFAIGEDTVRSRYDLDGRMVVQIEIERPERTRIPMRASAVNWCAFRGMLMKSDIHFRGRMGFGFRKEGSATLTLGDHPRAEPLRRLEIGSRPLFTAFIPDSSGILDDHIESWFLTSPQPPTQVPEGLESVAGLGLGEEWLPPPGHGPAGERPAATLPPAALAELDHESDG